MKSNAIYRNILFLTNRHQVLGPLVDATKIPSSSDHGHNVSWLDGLAKIPKRPNDAWWWHLKALHCVTGNLLKLRHSWLQKGNPSYITMAIPSISLYTAFYNVWSAATHTVWYMCSCSTLSGNNEVTYIPGGLWCWSWSWGHGGYRRDDTSRSGNLLSWNHN